MQYNDEQFMRRCLELARNGEGRVAPNPMVGVVIVHNGRIIGEGYHTCYGEAHAEVMAINSVTNKSLLKQSVIYVSLEPCCHYGKTPPCSQLIIDMGIPKVVIAAADPCPKVNGGGIKSLQNAEIDVIVGILEKEARELNRFFYTYHEKKRPYIILKWAESIDGYIDRVRGQNEPPTQITNASSRALVHRWRTQVQSIMVGTNTVIQDNPKLNVRNWQGNNPVRVIVDRNCRIPNNALVFNNDAKTLLFVSKKTKQNYGEQVTQIEIDFDNNVEETILTELHKLKIQSVFIEGGAQLLNNFINKNLWDEARVFVGDISLGAGVVAPQKPMQLMSLEIVNNDRLFVFRQNNL